MDETDTQVTRADILCKALTHVMQDDFAAAVQRFEIWRMCRKLSCRRASACRGDARRCCEMFVEWSEALASRDSQADLSGVRRVLMQRLGEKPA